MSQYLILPTNKDLMHHGVMGMSWGKRNGPPYPLNSAGKKALRKQIKQEKKAEKMVKKLSSGTDGNKKSASKVQEALEKRREANQKVKEEREKAEEQRKNEEKERIISSGTAAEAMKFQGQWTNDELRRIADRLDLEARISSKIPREKTTMDKINSAAKTAGDLGNFINKGYDLVKAFNKIMTIQEKKEDKEENKKNKNKEATTDKVLKKTSKSEKWKNNYDWDYDWW